MLLEKSWIHIIPTHTNNKYKRLCFLDSVMELVKENKTSEFKAKECGVSSSTPYKPTSNQTAAPSKMWVGLKSYAPQGHCTFTLFYRWNMQLHWYGYMFIDSGGTIRRLHFCVRVRPHSPMYVLSMTINRMWWYVFSPGVLGKMEYLFIPITPRSTVTRSWSTS